LTYATNPPQWKQAATPARKRGQQTRYEPALADEILDRLAAGESLRAICADPNMPSHVTVLRWVKDNPGVDENGANGFADQYARVRAATYELMADDVIAIGDSDILINGLPDNALVQRNRLMCDNRKWLLSKLLPRQFGDKVTQELTGDPDRPLVTMIQLVPVAPKRLPKPDADE
jgi:hypothetical protein